MPPILDIDLVEFVTFSLGETFHFHYLVDVLMLIPYIGSLYLLSSNACAARFMVLGLCMLQVYTLLSVYATKMDLPTDFTLT